ncbi:MAG: hypothetical protein J6V99_06360, partial [Neisseriaceae bacterium]|nr:hypothetical protein [Neisseriaceae bacterium]
QGMQIADTDTIKTAFGSVSAKQLAHAQSQEIAHQKSQLSAIETAQSYSTNGQIGFELDQKLVNAMDSAPNYRMAHQNALAAASEYGDTQFAHKVATGNIGQNVAAMKEALDSHDEKEVQAAGAYLKTMIHDTHLDDKGTITKQLDGFLAIHNNGFEDKIRDNIESEIQAAKVSDEQILANFSDDSISQQGEKVHNDIESGKIPVGAKIKSSADKDISGSLKNHQEQADKAEEDNNANKNPTKPKKSAQKSKKSAIKQDNFDNINNDSVSLNDNQEQAKQAARERRFEENRQRREQLRQNTDGKMALSDKDFAYNIGSDKERILAKAKFEKRASVLRVRTADIYDESGELITTYQASATERAELARIQKEIAKINQYEKDNFIQLSPMTKLGAWLPTGDGTPANVIEGFGSGILKAVTFGQFDLGEHYAKHDIGSFDVNSTSYTASNIAGGIYTLFIPFTPKGLSFGKMQKVSHWQPEHIKSTTLQPGAWVMKGSNKGVEGFVNRLGTGTWGNIRIENGAVKKLPSYKNSFETVVPKKDLSYPSGKDKWKGVVWGQRIYTPKK